MAADFPTRQAGEEFPTRPQQRRTPWWLPPLVVAALLGIYAVLTWLLPDAFQLPSVRIEGLGRQEKPSVLMLELGELPEWQPPSWRELFGEPAVSFREVLRALRAAQDDEAIRGLYLRLTASSLGWARREELREALAEFRARGKFIYAYVDAGSEGDYELALVADSIFVPRGALLMLSGFRTVGFFFPELLRKLGMEYHVEQFEEYKSAGEPLVRRSFSPAARENLHAVLQQRYERFVAWVKERRALDEERLRAVFAQGLQSPDSLKAWGLIDGVAHETEVLNLIAHRLGLKDSLEVAKRLIPIGRYVRSSAVQRWERKAPSHPVVGIVYAVGAIVPGREQQGVFGEPQVASDAFIEALRQAEQDEEVGAIIVRIDSPGGSVLASDAIWTELRRIAHRKPVYASMSALAASGGYYIAMGCDTIVAHPATLTGSIGVILALPNVAGTLRKLGVDVDTVKANPEALFGNPFLPYGEREKQRFHELGAEVYQLFLQKVAERRRMSLEQLRQYARGRVWSGQEAYQLRLVDTLGSFTTALELAKRRLGIPPERPVAIREFPRRKSFWEALLEDLFERGSQGEGRQLQAVAGMLRVLPGASQRLVCYLGQLWQLSQREPVLLALPWWWIVLSQ